jgi:hypothetical protein
VVNVVLRYGPKGLAKSATIGYRAEYDCVKKLNSYAMRRWGEFGTASLAIAQDLVLHIGP